MKALYSLLLISLTSCGIYDPKSSLSFTVESNLPVRAEEINFKIFQKEVLSRCVGCHADWQSEEVVNRFTKENLPEESRLYVTIQEGSMPKNSPPLSSRQLEITYHYISKIKYTRKVEAPLPDDGSPVSFDVVKENVFSVSCLPCHNSRLSSSEGLENSRWINKENPDNSKLLDAVVSGRMPKQRNLLTDNQIEYVRRYLRNFR